MVKLLNRLNLPQAFVDAVANDDYSAGESDITVTALLSPPRQVALKRKHEAELVEDASDRVWNLVGQIGHGILERANRVDLVETRFYVNILGWKVGGKFDTLTLENAILSDYKFTTVWKFSKGEVPLEYIQQLNMLAYILNENGVKVNGLRVIPILRDWSKPEAARSGEGYPKTNVLNLEVPYWEFSKTKAYMEERVRLHQEARTQVDAGQEPSLCTEEERWVKPTMYATKKVGAKRATKLFTTMKEAQDNLGGGMIVEVRKGEDVRCQMYCPVSQFCSHGKKYILENSTEGLF